MNENLIGVWRSDLDDLITQEYYGNISMEFCNDGRLIYTIFENSRTQAATLTYHVEGDLLITDQPSHPEKVETKFTIKEHVLELHFDGIKSRFLKV
jgi:outer membrane lipopolysaccharide assembly protein LptE/RlpB